MKTKFIKRRVVEANTTLSRSEIYRRIQNGTFPAPVSIGSRAVAWVEAEVQAWIDEQIEDSRSVAE